MDEELFGVDIINVVVYAIILVIIFFTLFGYFAKYQRTVLGPTDLTETIIFTNMLYTSADCLAYQDHLTGRVYAYEIDFSKFNSAQLQSCFKPLDKTKYFVTVTLKEFYTDKDIKKIESSETKTGAVRRVVQDVIVRDGSSIYPAKVQTEVWFNYG